MSLKIYYDPLRADDGHITGIQLTIQNGTDYLSVEDLGDNKFYYYDELTGKELIVDMSKQEEVDKLNAIISRVVK